MLLVPQSSSVIAPYWVQAGLLNFPNNSWIWIIFTAKQSERTLDDRQKWELNAERNIWMLFSGYWGHSKLKLKLKLKLMLKLKSELVLELGLKWCLSCISFDDHEVCIIFLYQRLFTVSAAVFIISFFFSFFLSMTHRSTTLQTFIGCWFFTRFMKGVTERKQTSITWIAWKL